MRSHFRLPLVNHQLGPDEHNQVVGLAIRIRIMNGNRQSSPIRRHFQPSGESATLVLPFECERVLIANQPRHDPVFARAVNLITAVHGVADYARRTAARIIDGKRFTQDLTVTVEANYYIAGRAAHAEKSAVRRVQFPGTENIGLGLSNYGESYADRNRRTQERSLHLSVGPFIPCSRM